MRVTLTVEHDGGARHVYEVDDPVEVETCWIYEDTLKVRIVGAIEMEYVE